MADILVRLGAGNPDVQFAVYVHACAQFVALATQAFASLLFASQVVCAFCLVFGTKSAIS